MNREQEDNNTLLFSKLIPSFITITGLGFGMLSLKLSMGERWGAAVICILIAGILDMFDGAAARILRSSSIFGAQLDSLCDVLNFGICPAIAIYTWGLNDIKIFGWLLMVLYVTCMTLRLARFNTMAIQHDPSKLTCGQKAMRNMFFTGVPAPAGATLLMLPIIMSISEICDQRLHPLQIQGYVLMVSLLLVSSIPTFSIKTLKISGKFVPLTILCFVLFTMCLIVKPWITMIIVCISYILSIPCSMLMYRRIRNVVNTTPDS